MPNKISIPVAEYAALNNKAMILQQIVAYAAANDGYKLDDFVKFLTPFVNAASLAMDEAAEDDNF